MATANTHSVGLRELRHKTSEVVARVRAGESLDVTEYGRPIARLVPVEDRDTVPLMARLEADGRVRRAARPGYRPRMRAGDGSNRLGDELAAMREEPDW